MKIYEGVIKSWKNESGFGFIKPNEGGRDVFIHIRDLNQKNYQPNLGDTVRFKLTADANGKPRAYDAIIQGVGSSPLIPRSRNQSEPKNSNKLLSTWIIAATPFMLTSGLVIFPELSKTWNEDIILICNTGYQLFLEKKFACNINSSSSSLKQLQNFIPFAVYFSLSLFTFIAYAVDKAKAQNNEWRISERTLHLFELAGGWPGALIAQRILRHKNMKSSFQIVFWIIVISHIIFLADLVLFRSTGVRMVLCQLQHSCK